MRPYHSRHKKCVGKKIFVKVSVGTSHTTKEVWKQGNGRIEGEILSLQEFRKIRGNKTNIQRPKVYVLKEPK